VATVLLAGAVLLAVLLAGESSRAMLASARLSCFMMAAICHLGFVGNSLGQPTKSIWRSLSFCKIWLESLKWLSKYRSLNILHTWLETPIPDPTMGVLGHLTNVQGAMSTQPPKIHPCTETIHLMCRLSKSLKRLLRYSNFYFFQDVGCPPSWICEAHFVTTHSEYLQVFILMQDLIGIAEWL